MDMRPRRSPHRRIGRPEQEHARCAQRRREVADAAVVTEEESAPGERRGQFGQGEIVGNLE